MNALRFTFKDAAAETAKFVEMADKLFDSFNVSSFHQEKYERKSFQLPYRSSNDFRLKVCVCVCVCV